MMLKRFFCTGPSRHALHHGYAKKGRIDENSPIQAVREVRDAPLHRVWELLVDAERWGQLDPAIHDVRLAPDVAEDASFTWANGAARMKSRFAVVPPDTELTRTGVSLGARAVHRHVLTPTAGDATVLRSEESVSGPVLALFGVTSAKLQVGLDTWLGAIKTAAEGPDAGGAR